MTDDPTRPIETSPVAPPAADTVAAPVMSGEVAGGGANRARWAIGLGVAGLAIAGVIAAVLVLGSRPTPAALTYIPASAVMVIEVRPDLPGDQLQKLGNLLAHFPGFADQSTLPDKLDESFAQLLGGASGGAVDYRTEIKPWLSGPAFLALLPQSNASADNPMSFFHGIASLTTTGTVSCDVLFENTTITHETYQGKDLVIGAGGNAACVLDGPQALIGDAQSVKAGIDAHAAGNGLDKDATYQEARTSLEGDQLATLYLDGAGYLDLLDDMMGLMPGTPGMEDSMACLPATFPAWIVQGLRTEDDAVLVDAVVEAAPAPTGAASAAPSLLPFPAAHQSAIMPFAPANTIVYLESQGVGVTVQNILAQLRACPLYGQALEMLNQTGDPAELAEWIDDVGLIVINGESGVTGGLVVVANDATAASERIGALKGLISLAGMGGQGIAASDSTINGVTVTTVTISNLGSLAPGGQVPPGFLPEDGTIEFSFAVKDRVILLGAGAGDTFMNAALTVQPGSALGDQAGYKAATSRALAASQLTFYLGIRDIIGIVEPLMPAESRTRWESEIKPYLAPFQALSMSSSTTGNLTGRSRFIVTINNP